jgi:hypothetical protein
MNSLVFAVDQLKTVHSSSLLMPTGMYSVAVKDMIVINQNLCPDPFFAIATSWAYVDINNKHCHQMNVKLYYPTLKNDTLSAYNPYAMLSWYDDILHKANSRSKAEKAELKRVLAMINNIKSYVALQGKIVAGKFPIIIFQPGFTYSTSDYENYITNLVSHGYIVIGINSYHNTSMMVDAKSLKANEPELPNNLFIKNGNADVAVSDLNYVLDNIKSFKTNSTDPVFQAMDLTRIGAFGHSLGGFSIYRNSRNHTKLAAAIALDVIGGKDFADYKQTSIPFLFFRSAGSSKAEQVIFGKKSKFYLGENEYLIFCTPDMQNNSYSMHNSFQDLVTLQYHHVAALDFKLNHVKPYKVLGYVNGYQLTAEINQEMLLFFDYFIKRKPVSVWNNCVSNYKDMLMFCNNSDVTLEF